ncbi:MAG: InlB B-repeat-containing protein [Clostridia bacterium]|nr:InlB B-repeat-containing protein [Clostridia bacterium]
MGILGFVGCEKKSATVFYEVSFNTNGGSEIASQTIEQNGLVAKPDDPTKEDYNFLGWFKDEDCVVAWNFETDLVVEDLTLYAKWEFAAYVATFSSDDNAKVYIYDSQDYTGEPYLSNTAYSRDGKTGELDKSGDGQINFLIQFEEGFILDELTINGDYKNLKDSTDTKQANTYRITKVASDLSIQVRSKQVAGSKMLLNMASYTQDDGKIDFAWDCAVAVDHVDIKILCDGAESSTRVESNSFQYDLEKNKSYNFEFTPYYSDTISGETVKVHRAYIPDAKNVAYTRMEIETSDFVWPTCDYVSPPAGAMGASIANNNYVQSNVKVFNAANTLIFDSENMLKDSADVYSGAKIKIRGNTSAYGDKKPYKIKLNKAADLMKGLYTRTIYPNYKNKEFLLLPIGQYDVYLVGREVSNFVTDDYEFAYAYISLYINGDYKGLYVLTDSVNEQSCHVEEDGFVVEYDPYWWNEDLYFDTDFTGRNKEFGITFKYPDADDISVDSAECIYIKDYLNEFEDCLFSGGDVSQYIDIESFASWLLIHDILTTRDAGGSNMYMVKNNSQDSLLRAGPTWDFDSINSGTDHLAGVRWMDFYVKYLAAREDFAAEHLRQFNLVKGGLTAYVRQKIEEVFVDEIDVLVQYEGCAYNLNYNSLKARALNGIDVLNTHIAWMEANL